MTVDPARIAVLMERERTRFVREHPRSRELGERAGRALLSGVPMNWMTRWPGDFPVWVAHAEGARLVDVDGLGYVDFCLGDTGAMTGHAPAPTVAAIAREAARGLTTMLPSEDGVGAAEQLRRRFGLPSWQFTLSATDANRFVLRLAREVTGRPKVLVHNHCDHGSVDETVATLHTDGTVGPRHGSVGPQVDPARTTRVVEINDLEALECELAHGDVAAVLVEPALTNIGIVLAEDGYHDGPRTLTREYGAVLVIDETHVLLRAGGLHRRLRPGAGRGNDRQADRGRAPHRCLRAVGRVRAARAGHDDLGGDGRGRHRRHAGRQPARAGRRAHDARGGPHRGGLRAHDRACRALPGRRRARHRRARPALARDPAGLPRGVHVRRAPEPHRGRGRCRLRRRTRCAAAPVRTQ